MMELFSEKSQCCGCMACADICAQKAIEISVDAEGFLYPKIQPELCVNCGRCKTVCHFSGRAPQKPPCGYFAAQAKEPALRGASTSGAVFPVLANSVLAQGGAVYGAGFDGDMRVRHQKAASRSELERLIQTKYVQSDTAGIFRRVQEELQAGGKILFTGTPCQVEALRRFLGKEYENLFLVDLICYGVPSPGVWAKYAAYLEKKHHGKLTEFRFRDKRLRNNGHAVSWVVGGREYCETYARNPFTDLYASNCMLRPSCHACPFAAVERGSDITIGDFWGIEKAVPQMDDGMGTSLVILHSAKGAALWSDVKSQFRYAACGAGEVLQPRLMSPTAPSPRRDLFFMLYRRLPFGAFILLKRIRRILHAGKQAIRGRLRR